MYEEEEEKEKEVGRRRRNKFVSEVVRECVRC